MIVVVIMLLILGMLEFGFLFDHTLSLSYSTREGARVGAALANGGGNLGCGAGQSPNAATVDPLIIGAVQRVMTSPGSPVRLDRVEEIRIYKATATGAQSGTQVNVWNYNAGGGPVVDGRALDFSATSVGWAACARSNGAPPDSIGVTIRYRYNFVTPLAGIMRVLSPGTFDRVTVSDGTVMALNPS